MTLKFSASDSTGNTGMYTLSSVGKLRKQKISFKTIQVGYLFIQSLHTPDSLCNFHVTHSVSRLQTTGCIILEYTRTNTHTHTHTHTHTQMLQKLHACAVAISM
jgi:hypothetical protein